MGTHPIFESDFDCLTEKKKDEMRLSELRRSGIRPGNHSNHHVSRHAQVQLSMYEANAFKEQKETFAFIARSQRRFTESWYKWSPAIIVYYAVILWVDEELHHEARKNPADYANDE